MTKIGGSGFKTSVATTVVVGIWIYNVAFNIPVLLWAKVHVGWSGALACYASTDPSYNLAARIINFYVPLVITWTSYIGIIYKFNRSVNKVIQSAFNLFVDQN